MLYSCRWSSVLMLVGCWSTSVQLRSQPKSSGSPRDTWTGRRQQERSAGSRVASVPSNIAEACGREASSVLPEISLTLPFADLPDILVPLSFLCLDKPLIDVFTERLSDHRRFLETLERLVQIPRQLVDPVSPPLAET